jgi:hypothetical protein
VNLIRGAGGVGTEPVEGRLREAFVYFLPADPDAVSEPVRDGEQQGPVSAGWVEHDGQGPGIEHWQIVGRQIVDRKDRLTGEQRGH